MIVVLTYKRDVECADDHQLALLELTSLAKTPPQKVSHKKASELLAIKKLPVVRKEHVTFAVDVSIPLAKLLVRRLAFWDFMLVRGAKSFRPSQIAVGAAWEAFDEITVFATQSQVLEWTAYARDNDQICDALSERHGLRHLIEVGDPYVAAAAHAALTPMSRRKNEYLTHGFHKYKAKFFPRLARALINYTCPHDTGVVLDPFCGSGTTGVEASLMGIEALEFDIDPLSAFIASSKAVLGHLNLEKFQQAISRLPKKPDGLTAAYLEGVTPYQLPRFLLERKPKRLSPEVLAEIESEATFIKAHIATCKDDETKSLLELSFSHALSTKVSLRWMGTGDNRYALEIAKRSLYSLFCAQLHYMMRKLGSWAAIKDGKFVAMCADVKVGVSDCTALPLPDNSVDAVVTSPPYLPAASGRETYLRSRAASLLALGLMTEEAVHQCEREIVGSILATRIGTAPLPASVTELVDWMLPQRERTAKAKPTAAYFEKLGRALKEMKRVLKPGGTIALVVSKEHTFYEMKTRKVLCRFDMVKAISELGTEAQYDICLELDRVQELELLKMDFVARPGAQGTYSEAILFFRKSRV